MPELPRIGSKHERSFVVSEQHAIGFADLPPVLSTPWLIWELEHAALELVAPHLPPEKLTVGVQIDVTHSAPALVGSKVRCEAKLILIDGISLTFQVTANSQGRTLAHGIHRRKIVDKERLRKSLTR